MAIKVAINGFGRIGRLVFRAAQGRDDIEIVALNDLASNDQMALLLKYDSNFGKFDGTVESTENGLKVNGKDVKIFTERDPENLPWGDLGVDIVVESTGFFRDHAKASKHITAGAKKVIISAPSADPDIMVVMGVNEDKITSEHKIISNASCTTNCLSPVAKVLHEAIGITRATMTTVHSYTLDQRILDGYHKDDRRARACAQSIIPTTTGAAKAVAKVIPELEGIIDGFAMRVPTATVSIVDFVAQVAKPVTKEEVNDALIKASQTGPLSPYLEVCDEPLVSVDFKKNPASSIVDLLSTNVIDGTLVKIISWYDNEWGYSNRVVDLLGYLAKMD